MIKVRTRDGRMIRIRNRDRVAFERWFGRLVENCGVWCFFLA